MKQARDLENRAAHPNTNSEDYAPLATNGQLSEFYCRFVTECSYGCLWLHCGVIAERRLDRKGLVIFPFFKIPMKINNEQVAMPSVTVL